MPTGHASLMPALRRVVLAGAGADRTDGQVLGAFVADRDADAFGLLVRRHGPMVLGVCRRVIGDHTTAEDAFQAVFLVLARRAAAVRPREQVGNWLYGIAYRTALKARAVLARRRGREKQVDVMPEPPSLPRADDWADLQPVIDEELARLPEKLRGPVVLCDIEGRPQREVAKHLGVPPATLATRLATARRTLAQRLTKRGVALSGGALATLLTAHGTASAAVSHALTNSLSRAAEAVAAGGAVSALVSAGAVQLSEGVLRMMLLTKLKAVAVAAVTALTLTTGVGLGLVPARGDEPGPGPGTARVQIQTEKAATAKPAEPPAKAIDKAVVEKWKNLTVTADPQVDDATFLRRLSLDLRGGLPTDIETFFFVSDPEDAKRQKVVTWLLEEDGVQKAYAARVLGVDEKQVRTVKVVGVGDQKAKSKALVVVVDATGATKPQVKSAAFSPDGRTMAVEVFEAQPDVVRSRTVKVVGPDGKPVAHVAPLVAEVELLTEDLVGIPGQPGAVRVQTARAGKQEPGRGGSWIDGPGEGARWRVVTGDKLVTDKDGAVRVWDTATGKGITTVDFDADGKLDTVWSTVDFTPLGESDLDFLKRVTLAARGTPPTALEERYFTEDKDPKKREKLVDTLLKEPAVAKKLGDDFKKKVLAGGTGTASATKEWKFLILPTDPKQGGKEGVFEFKLDGKPQVVVPGKPVAPKQGVFEFKFEGDGQNFKVVPGQPTAPKQGGKEGVYELKIEGLKLDFTKPQPPAKKVEGKSIELVIPLDSLGRVGDAVIPAPPKPPVPPKPPATPAAPQADKLEKLVASLLAAKKTDAEMLEAVTLATVGRLPTDTEKRLTLGLVAKSADRKAAWIEVAKALSGSSSDGPKTEVHFRIVNDGNKPAVIAPAKP